MRKPQYVTAGGLVCCTGLVLLAANLAFTERVPALPRDDSARTAKAQSGQSPAGASLSLEARQQDRGRQAAGNAPVSARPHVTGPGPRLGQPQTLSAHAPPTQAPRSGAVYVAPTKPASLPRQPAPVAPAGSPRQGGEDCATSFIIPGLPFVDTGTTVGNFNDYDWACPYTGSTSPDVVYSYTPPADGVVNISLCVDVTNYDSKLYVYAGVCSGAPIACNDDACTSPYFPSAYVSRLNNVSLTGGTTYYIVVDGYAGASGSYQINIDEFQPCAVSCPPGGIPEGEPNCGLPTDFVNGGCNSAPPVFAFINCGDTVCGTGAFDGATRDTDWFEVNLATPSFLTWTATAEFDVVIGLMEQINPGVPGCENITGYVNPYALGGPCQTVAVTTPCLQPGTYYFFVAPNFTLPVPCPADYTATLTCVSCAPVLGACCLLDNSCVETSPEICTSMVGTYQGDNTICATANCQSCQADCENVPYNPEGEPICADEYIDNYNGGCNSVPPIFQPLICGDWVCGTSGTFLVGTSNVRDTDWYEVALSEQRQLTWTVTAEFPPQIYIIDGNSGCASPAIIASATGNTCQTSTVSACVGPGMYWLWVGPSVFSGVPCGLGYQAGVTCTPCPGSDCAGCRGNMNGDDKRDGQDIAGFVGCFTSGFIVPPGCGCADMNSDYFFTIEDVAGFVQILLNPLNDCSMVQSFSTSAVMELEIFPNPPVFIQMGACPGPDNTTVRWEASPYVTAVPIETEIIGMSLQGFHPQFGPVIVQEHPLLQSAGTINNVVAGGDGSFESGDSSFGVFVQIILPNMGGLTLDTGGQPVPVQATGITSLPPSNSTFASGPIHVPLYPVGSTEPVGTINSVEHTVCEQEFCIYVPTCISGACDACAAALGEQCYASACPNGTCAGSFQRSCGDPKCCVIYKLVACATTTAPPCPSGDFCPKCDPTVFPVAPTYCPEEVTECPREETQCPLETTVCPENETFCPEDETRCPAETTVCPVEDTQCPARPTECPVETTKCPAEPTVCEDTICPPVPTECPVDPTVCDYTCYPSDPTYCPEDFTNCPQAYTWCPQDFTWCPEDYTFCPEWLTECYVEPTYCEFTNCPADPTYCGIVFRAPTYCPVVPTECPVYDTECPVVDTECPFMQTLCPECPACEIEISDCEPAWLPLGRAYGTAVGDPGNSVTFTATILAGAPRKIAFFLDGVSSEPGICINYGDESGATPDLKFIQTATVNPPAIFDPPSGDGMTIVTKDPVIGASVTVTCYDYGAWGRIRACCYNPPPLPPGCESYTEWKKMPVDDLPGGGNHIADAWRAADASQAATWDDDEFPGTMERNGDGESFYEEYRGSMVGFIVAHKRMDPHWKELYLYDEDLLHLYGHAGHKYIFLTLIKFEYVNADPAALMNGPGLAAAGHRKINHKSEFAKLADQYALHVKKFPLVGRANWGLTDGAALGPPNTADPLVKIDDAQIATDLRDAVTDQGGNPNAGGAENAAYLNVSARMTTRTVSHEMGHGTNVRHAPAGVHHDCAAGGRASPYGDNYCGDIMCVMRYTYDLVDTNDATHPNMYGIRTAALSPAGTLPARFVFSGYTDSDLSDLTPVADTFCTVNNNCRGDIDVKDP